MRGAVSAKLARPGEVGGRRHARDAGAGGGGPGAGCVLAAPQVGRWRAGYQWPVPSATRVSGTEGKVVN